TAPQHRRLAALLACSEYPRRSLNLFLLGGRLPIPVCTCLMLSRTLSPSASQGNSSSEGQDWPWGITNDQILLRSGLFQILLAKILGQECTGRETWHAIGRTGTWSFLAVLITR